MQCREKPGESFLRQLHSNAVCLNNNSRSAGFRDRFASCMQGLSPIRLLQARNIAAPFFGWCCRIRLDNPSRQRSILYLTQPQQRSCQATWTCRRVHFRRRYPRADCSPAIHNHTMCNCTIQDASHSRITSTGKSCKYSSYTLSMLTYSPCTKSDYVVTLLICRP